MKYCCRCGKTLSDHAVVCVHCGCAVENTVKVTGNWPSERIAILSFFFPIVGLILYLVDSDVRPLRAQSAGKGALAGFIVGVLGSIVCGCMILC